MTTPQQTHVLTDLGGIPIPQEWDALTQGFTSLQGHGGASSIMKARWWQVGSSPAPTTTQIATLSLSGLALNLSAATQAQWIGARFGIKINNQLCEAVVTGVTSAGVITLDSALPSAPAVGTVFYLIPPEQTSLTGSNATIGQVIPQVAGQPVTSSNPLPTVVQGLEVQSVTATNIVIQGYATQQVVFQNAVSASGNGATISVNGWKTLLIEVFGANSPAGTVNFQAASISGVFVPITGVNLNGLSSATSTSSISTTPTLWQFDVSALDSFQCPVTWTAGTITVQGRLMA
ncbi:MAG: hypothetical protein K6T83_01220 [Alicyclobacillus sp.]|nr:hypothetical protein [Alicyclobacillus sp.]